MREYYVDESSAKGYLLAAAVVQTEQRTHFRNALKLLRKPGQNRLHFVDESDSRRREILSAISHLNARVNLFISTEKNQKRAREDCLIALVKHASENAIVNIVLERDESVIKFDDRVLYREKRGVSHAATVNFRHEQPRAEPLLWIADAFAWSYVKGGDWRRRVLPHVDELIRVE